MLPCDLRYVELVIQSTNAQRSAVGQRLAMRLACCKCSTASLSRAGMVSYAVATVSRGRLASVDRWPTPGVFLVGAPEWRGTLRQSLILGGAALWKVGLLASHGAIKQGCRLLTGGFGVSSR